MYFSFIEPSFEDDVDDVEVHYIFGGRVVSDPEHILKLDTPHVELIRNWTDKLDRSISLIHQIRPLLRLLLVALIVTCVLLFINVVVVCNSSPQLAYAAEPGSISLTTDNPATESPVSDANLSSDYEYRVKVVEYLAVITQYLTEFRNLAYGLVTILIVIFVYKVIRFFF